ncbi:hypothetical protein [Sulfitobacter sp. THAF37]|uniref:hypothetical protein n=1 Tax=Sulfitobacter sp. THAF37 TaxID=2587855 RepID=UPI0020C77616|nr:hypothetical protein [Sulfitobacter sp. THAF37]
MTGLSLVAIDVTTGEDVWDYDLGLQATLLDYRATPAVLLPSRQDDIYILNRETGAPLTPVGELTDLPTGEIEPDFVSKPSSGAQAKVALEGPPIRRPNPPTASP